MNTVSTVSRKSVRIFIKETAELNLENSLDVYLLFIFLIRNKCSFKVTRNVSSEMGSDFQNFPGEHARGLL